MLQAASPLDWLPRVAPLSEPHSWPRTTPLPLPLPPRSKHAFPLRGRASCMARQQRQRQAVLPPSQGAAACCAGEASSSSSRLRGADAVPSTEGAGLQQQHQCDQLVLPPVVSNEPGGLLPATSDCGGSGGDSGQAAGPPAFVFDIDGVLVQGAHVLPAAKEALRGLYSADGQRPLVPVCFLTNGGGITEADKAEQLTRQMGVTVQERQVVMAHTPFRDLVPRYGTLPVLVVGRGALRVARHYGFQQPITSAMLARALPHATPFLTPLPDECIEDGEVGQGDEAAAPASPCPAADLGGVRTCQPCPSSSSCSAVPPGPLAALLVFNDPLNWYHDLQLGCDVLVSGGVLVRSATTAEQAAEEPATVLAEKILKPPAVPAYFSNADLVFANEFPTPRFGQGAYGVALEALFCALTGLPAIPCKTTYGKPTREPYRMVERLLMEQAAELGLVAQRRQEHKPAAGGDAIDDLSRTGGSTTQQQEDQPLQLPFSGVYAVGDNPAADVRGANAAGPPWISVLVRTGVFRGPQPNCTVDPAHMVVDDVGHAVRAALHQARSRGWKGFDDTE